MAQTFAQLVKGISATNAPANSLTIDSSGRLGIGTTSPSSSLVVSNGGANGIEFGPINGDIFTYNRSTSAYTNTLITCNEFVVRTNGSNERARIDSSGRLLVGTSTARANFFNSTDTALVQVEGANNNAQRYAGHIYGVAGIGGPWHVFAKHRSNSIGGTTVVIADDQVGTLSFQGSDGTEFVEAARIEAFVDGTPGANDMPGRLVFSTTADGASNPTERMRIGQNGKVQMFANANDNVLIMRSAEGAGTATYVLAGARSATGISDGTIVFGVFTNGNAVNTNNSYGAISDLKLKENVVDAGSQWDDLKALQVRKYNFKEGQTHTQIGLVAQEAELVSPGLVSESPDRDEDGNDLGTVTKSVNYSVLYMKAVKALQEAMERIETLEAEVSALKAL